MDMGIKPLSYLVCVVDITVSLLNNIMICDDPTVERNIHDCKTIDGVVKKLMM